MKRVATALALATLLASSLAHADEATFTSADTNTDGTLSLEEISAVLPSVTGEAFNTADTDGSGSLSAEELETAMASGLIAAQ